MVNPGAVYEDGRILLATEGNEGLMVSPRGRTYPIKGIPTKDIVGYLSESEITNLDIQLGRRIPSRGDVFVDPDYGIRSLVLETNDNGYSLVVTAGNRYWKKISGSHLAYWYHASEEIVTSVARSFRTKPNRCPQGA